jgi:hypothetical protein
LSDKAVSFFKEGFGIDHHPVSEHTSLSLVDDAGGKQVQHERLVTNLNRVTSVVATLIAHDDIEVLGEEVNDLSLAFISPLGADDGDDFRH